MSAHESTKFQVNFKTSAGTLINVYAESVVDGIATMNEMAAAVDMIKTIEQRLSGMPGGTVTLPSAPPVAVAEAAPAAAAPAGHVCKHGAMVYKTGISQKTGKEWRAYMCAGPRGEQCDAEFLR